MTVKNEVNPDLGFDVDPLLWRAVGLLSLRETEPVSFLQRHFIIGYERATQLHHEVRRIHLLTAIRSSWAAVLEAYWQGLINNECTLQADLFRELKSRLHGYWVICEPKLEDGTPDIVVIRANQIEAFVEIKFPKAKLSECQKDVKKLRKYVSKESYSQLELDPKTGCYLKKEYKVSTNCYAVFANIGDDFRSLNYKDLSAQWENNCPANFLVLSESIKPVRSIDMTNATSPRAVSKNSKM